MRCPRGILFFGGRPFPHVGTSFCPSGLSLLPEPPCLLSPASSAWFGIPAGWLICVSIRPSVSPSVCSTSNCQGSATGHRHRSFHSRWVRQVLGCVTHGTRDQGVGRPPQLGTDRRGDGGRARGCGALGTGEAGVKGSKTESPRSCQVSWVLVWARTGLSRAASGSPSQNCGSPQGAGRRPPQPTKVCLRPSPWREPAAGPAQAAETSGCWAAGAWSPGGLGVGPLLRPACPSCTPQSPTSSF